MHDVLESIDTFDSIAPTIPIHEQVMLDGELKQGSLLHSQ